MSAKKPDIGRLRERFDVSPDGRLFYRVSLGGWIRSGREAGYLSANGYRYVGIDGACMSVHLVVFAISNNRWPAGHVDHIDGNTLNNSPANLRDVTVCENMQNLRRARSDSAEGVMGVRRQTRGNGWMARITANKKRIHLGTFKSAEEAHAAYLEARRKYQKGNTL